MLLCQLVRGGGELPPYIVCIVGRQCIRMGRGFGDTPQIIILAVLYEKLIIVVQLVHHRVQSSILVISITLDDGFYCIAGGI